MASELQNKPHEGNGKTNLGISKRSYCTEKYSVPLCRRKRILFPNGTYKYNSDIL